MKKQRVMVLMHEDLVPPETDEGVNPQRRPDWRTEYDVVSTLEASGHEVLKLGVHDELAPIRRSIKEWSPDLVFNLMEAFHGESVYDQHVVAYLELLRQPYTGCHPRGLTLARDKALCKKILHYHRVLAPAFVVFPRGRTIRRPASLGFPLIVKSLVEEASRGISQASVVDSDEKLEQRVRFIHERVGTDAIAEQYIDGRELYVGVLGNDRVKVLPTWEIMLDKLPAEANRIATERVKWNQDYQLRHGIDWGPARLEDAVEKRIARLSRRIYRILDLSGYARLDFRLDPQGRLYLLEANPNPDIADGDEFAASAESAGISYPKLLDKILQLGLPRP